jgi:acetyl esterase/lipase
VERDRTYLALSAASALNTANAISPFNRRGPLSALGFFPGWLTSELPLQAMGAQMATTALMAVTGGFTSRKAKAGLALNVASWAGLLSLQHTADQAGEVLETALREGLGPDYRSRMAAEFAPPTDIPITRRQVLQPFKPDRKRYRTGANIAYGDKGKRNLLDIWHRQDLPPDAGAPVLFQVHGGGWVIGEKEQQGNPLMGHLAERGWVSVAINYPLSPKATWPDHIVAVKQALAWTKAHIAEYGGDPNFIVITGGSAGGHLCSLAALTPNEAIFQPGFEDADTTVQGAVPFYGVYDFHNRDGTGRGDMTDFLGRVVFKLPLASGRDVWSKASSMSWVRPDAPPFFILHGANDGLVPVEQARSFVSMLKSASTQPVVYAELPRAQHAFEVFTSVRTLHAVRAVDRFVSVLRSEHGAASVPSLDDEPAAAARG